MVKKEEEKEVEEEEIEVGDKVEIGREGERLGKREKMIEGNTWKKRGKDGKGQMKKTSNLMEEKRLRIESLTSAISSVSLKGAVSMLNCLPGAEEMKQNVNERNIQKREDESRTDKMFGNLR